GNRGGSDRRLAADVGPGVAARMPELNGSLRAAAMNLGDEKGETGQESIVVNSEFAGAMAAGSFGSRHLHGDEPGAAARARRVISEGIVGDRAVRVGSARRHGRHDDAV